MASCTRCTSVPIHPLSFVTMDNSDGSFMVYENCVTSLINDKYIWQLVVNPSMGETRSYAPGCEA